MSLSTDLAIGAAERLERTAGAGAGLGLWRRLASSAGSADLRGRAVLGGLRCAAAVRDLGALRDLSLLWATVDAVSEPVWDDLFATQKALARGGLGIHAAALAHAELRRAETARGLYAFARCLDVSGDGKAAAAFGAAITRGEKEGAARLVRTSRVRRAAWLSRSAETLAEAIEEAKRVSASEVSPAEQLVLARVLLRAPSRFTRASALGLLDAIVSAEATVSAEASAAGAAGARRDLASRALALAARHADDRSDELTPLEVDRLLALFSREPRAKELAVVRDTVRAIDRLARAKEKQSESELDAALAEAARVQPSLGEIHRRAREILQGRFEAWDAEAPSAHPEWAALLDAVVAMRDSAWPRVAHALRRLAESAERGERLPPHVWTVAMAALGSDDAEVRGVAGRVVAAMVETTSAAPPRGWLPLAHALAACGMEHLATTARRSAALAKETGATEALALSLTRSGWQLAQAGERSRAIAHLREARQLAASPRPAPSAPAPGRDGG
jgi:hypothetical protein